jgi:GNAT superfamily N-acetyltransferase
MIRTCNAADTPTIAAVINDGAQAYRGVIPDDCWSEPYMPLVELEQEIAAGVRFYGFETAGALTGVMGIQDRGEVDLIRHAYVRTAQRRAGIGGALLKHIDALSPRPILLGTWAASTWALDFYCKHGYRILDRAQTNQLLRRFWTVPEEQMATSVVLANPRWPA